LRALKNLCITKQIYKLKILWKDVDCRDFLLFVLHLFWFKTYPHTGVKQRKTKKLPKMWKKHFFCGLGLGRYMGANSGRWMVVVLNSKWPRIISLSEGLSFQHSHSGNMPSRCASCCSLLQWITCTCIYKIMYEINAFITSFVRKLQENIAESWGFPIHTAKCVILRSWRINAQLWLGKIFHILPM
jgi:hypothetical protein